MENKYPMPLDEHENQPQENWPNTIVVPGRLDQNRHVEDLLEKGFHSKEITQLLALREHLYENTEMRQRIEDNPYLCFMRWLYRQGDLTEDE